MDKDLYLREIERCGGMMYRVAFTILRSPDDCRDAMQEAALKAWEKRDALRDESRFAAWITRILIRACYDIRRRRGRVISLEEMATDPAVQPPDRTLCLALQSLPEKLRLPLMLQYSEGMSYREISRVLRLPESTVRGRIHRAKEALRKELEA
ncbi:MAG: sigma-70 family RNA polymerase sigma factor [Clostridia bacterium]|nr:sigma-70 family RNA polymerase sigma factor [Clostridia bacterium]